MYINTSKLPSLNTCRIFTLCHKMNLATSISEAPVIAQLNGCFPNIPSTGIKPELLPSLLQNWSPCNPGITPHANTV